MHAHDIVTLCGILAAGFACQWLAWRVRLPAILFLLIIGIVAGPVLNWLEPDKLLGDLTVPLVSISVAIILFEGSLTLKYSELRGHGTVVIRLVTIGVFITWICSTLAAYYLLDWDLYLAALFGAIVTVSGPTVVMPLLRAVRPAKSVASVLRWEAILIDPLGAILGLLVFDFILATQASQGFLDASVTVGTIVVAGTLLGAGGGYLFGMAIRKRIIPDFLRNYSALAAALTIFALAEAIHGESGLLAVTVMGIQLANMRHVDLEDILDFKESLTLLLVGGLFVLLAARIDLGEVQKIGLGALVIVALLQFVIGPLRAIACTIGSSLKWRERLFLGWVFPRGIVAAAISALFALRLESIGVANAGSLVPLVFSVIIGTVIVQSLTGNAAARWLNVAEPDPTGVLIVGSNRVALAIATALNKTGVSVLVADSHWATIRKARMLGLPTFYGSAVSGYADQNMDLTGLGTLLAVSRRPGLNELACVRFAADFGRDNVYTISDQSDGKHAKHNVTGDSRGRVLFFGKVSLNDMSKRLSAGDELKTTLLTAEFNFDDYREKNPDGLPVFATDPSGHVRFPVVDEKFEPGEGWSVTSFVPTRLRTGEEAGADSAPAPVS